MLELYRLHPEQSTRHTLRTPHPHPALISALRTPHLKPYCAAVGFSDVTSANIVGFQNKDVRFGQSFQGCSFDQIDLKDGGVDIQNLIPVDEDGELVGGGDVNIQFYNAAGQFIIAYAYYEDEGLNDGLKAGWYNEDTEELAEYVFNQAEGFKVYSGSAAKFVYSGQVNMAETDVPARFGQSFQYNIRPTETDIQDITPVDEDGEIVGGGDVNIQFYTAAGQFINAYAYYEDDGLNDGLKAGWYNEDTEELAEHVFGPAEGFKVYSGAACYLRFPEL